TTTTAKMKTKIETRLCRICNEEKALELMEVDKRYKTGYSNRCKACKFNSNTKPAKAHRRLFRSQAKYNVPVEITQRDFRIFHDYFGDVCIYCLKDLSFETATYDHIIPLSHRDTSNRPENIHICCASCNARKGNKPLYVFYEDNPQIDKRTLDIILRHVAHFKRQSVEEVDEMFSRH